MVLGLQFVSRAIGPATINGISTAALYGVIAVALVLSFRMSRTVAFVHGGIAILCGFLYWYLTYGNESAYYPKGGVGGQGGGAQTWPKIPTLFLVVLIGGLVGLVYGSIVMGRMRLWPRVTVTTFSLGVMLLIAGVISGVWPGLTEDMTSPFGKVRYKVFGQVVTRHEIVSVTTLFVLVAVLTFLLVRTRMGTYVRAIADDSDAAEFVGIPVEKVGTGVWALSGMVSGFAGILIVGQINVSIITLLLVMLRAFTVGMLGGFNSLPLALVGALMFGEVEALIGGGVFGSVSGGAREVVLMVFLLGALGLIFRFSKHQSELLEAA